ncbi:alpha/beta hydrolase [Flagellimonas nanhaiensis]|uniref:Alpha/beta hydrolase n=1 Tax=Flagellimonas nanhaiensis TaxID=2292706 RepID=A0A371JLE6_9FLAO|nr:alpha/beta hydrolase [Allomuricauda nanhaiensis]RDY57776.1 alpha/beta hydrolase [Allomuricauda nanhaiensis]
MNKIRLTPILICLVTLMGTNLSAQDAIVSLWPNKIPNQSPSKEKEEDVVEDIRWIRNVQNPIIEVYLPGKGSANGRAVLIFPGGGYHGLAYDWEGSDIAKMLNSKGIAGIVVKYRLPLSKSITEKKEVVPLQDAQRAMRLVRSRAKEWNINEDEIGVIGFSAGGHLASTLGVYYGEQVYEKQDDVDDLNARPNFMALIYPVISMEDETTHVGTRGALLGENPTDELINRFSTHKNISETTPPTFILHAVDDEAVPVENSVLLFSSLKNKGVPATMHIYPTGGHGFSLALQDKRLKGWVGLLFDWIENLE